MNALPLADGIRRARSHPTLQLEVVLVTRSLACPRCGCGDLSVLRGADLDGRPAQRCKRCSTGFRVLLVSSPEVVAALDEASTTTSSRCPPALLSAASAPVTQRIARATSVRRCTIERTEVEIDRSERAAAKVPPDAEDREFAGEVLRAWRVRLAAVRTQKRMDDDAPPLDEDLAILERVADG